MIPTSCRIAVAVAVLFAAGLTCLAQDPEPPLTWKGEGVASMISSEEGVRDLNFNVRLHIDAAGMVKGEVYTDEGSASIERFYYGERVTFGSSELVAQRIVIVIMIGKTSDDPTLVIMDGRSLADQFCYGELLVKRYEKDGDIEKGLDIGNKTAEEVYESYMPTGLKNALKKSTPWGCFQMSGKFVTE